MEDNALKNKLIELKERYKEDLPDTVTQLVTEWAQISYRLSQTVDINNVIQLVHAISGSSNTYGHSKLNRETRKAETKLQTIQTNLSQIRDLTGEISEVITTLQHDLDSLLSDKGLNEYGPGNGSNYEQEIQRELDYKKLTVITCDPALIKPLNNALESNKLSLKIYHSAEAAIVGLKKQPSSVVLVDLDSISVAAIEQLQVSGTIRTTSIAYTSTHDTLENRLTAIKYDGEAFFDRPWYLQDVIELIESKQKANVEESNTEQPIVLVEEDKVFGNTIRTVFASLTLKVILISEPAKLLEELCKYQPSLVILSLNCQAIPAEQLARVIKQHNVFKSLPVVYLTNDTEVDNHLSIIGLPQDLVGEEDLILSRYIEHNCLIETITKKLKYNQEKETKIQTDALTGLMTVTGNKEILSIPLAYCTRKKHQLAAAIVEISNLQEINQVYGYQAGQHSIKQLSYDLRLGIRCYDHLARIGGGSFLIMMTDSQYMEIEKKLHLLQKKRREEKIKFSESEYSIILSYAVCQYEWGLSIDEMLKKTYRMLKSTNHIVDKV